MAIAGPPQVEAAEAAAIPLMAALALISFVSFLILWGLRVTCVDWTTALLRWFAKHTPSLPVIGKLDFGAFDALASGIEDTVGASLSYAAAKFEQSTIFWYDGATGLVHYLADSLEWDLAQVEHGFRVLVDSYIPWAVRQGHAQVYRGIDELTKQADHVIRAAEQRLARGIDSTLAELRKAREEALKAAGAGAAAGEAAVIPLLRPFEDRIAETDHYIRVHVEGRLRAVEKEAAAAATALAIARAVARGWPMFRCSNARRWSQILCGVPTRLLDTLLLDSIEALAVTDLCQIVSLMAGAAKAAVPELIAFVDVENALIGCHGATAPPPLGVPALRLPAVNAGLAL